MTLANYLRKMAERGIIDFCVRATPQEDGTVRFSIRPADRDDDTREYVTAANIIALVPFMRADT